MSVELTNIKVSIKCNQESLDSVENNIKEKNLTYKRYNNFIVLRSDFVYTIFRQSKNKNNHINITKIKKYENISKAVENLKNFNLNVIDETLKIDNITGSLNLGKEVYIQDIISSVKSNSFSKNIIISYNNEKFPGLFLKVKDKDIKVGTIIVFYSGKVIFVGCKSSEDLECLAILIHALTLMSL
jgi:TATA-box binding protein (TBP) (component of TFIID and TFIIIB)